MRPRLPLSILAALTALPLAACSAHSNTATPSASTTPPPVTTTAAAPEQFDIYVADQQAPCTGVAPQTCLQVRRNPNSPWELHYFGIDGFDYEPGYTYHLTVEQRPWPNPPTDAPSVTWHLVRQISKDPA
ncbi:DUF4377 domain-containing protein [Nocardia tengchongensis]|uniref:DUF4377 domain-containing protein n=1 Tax=Nocardia tengchongensis TaxID=2055889 RepID=UPI0033C0CB11